MAIGGMAIGGVGGAFAELVGSAGVAELAPVKSRGTYLGTAFLVVLPFSACSSYGQILQKFALTSSAIVFFLVDMEMGSLDLGNIKSYQFQYGFHILSSASSI